jgi:hypothetical protein
MLEVAAWIVDVVEDLPTQYLCMPRSNLDTDAVRASLH